MRKSALEEQIILLQKRVAELTTDLDDAKDARLVLHAMGHSRRVCFYCKRRTVTPGYVCWKCHKDNSAVEHGEAE